MGKGEAADWSPESYGRFSDLRLRPALDLLAQVGDMPEGNVVDLGCGAGAAGPALASRFSKRKLIGVDGSPAMLAKAAATRCYGRCDLADISAWEPGKPPALIFSNAVLHWLAAHETLVPRLAGCVVPGGVLAVQMPMQWLAPSHRLLREIAGRMFPERFDYSGWQPPVAPPQAYWDMLSPLGSLTLWETEYLQPLPPDASAHPVRRFTESTALRPILEKLSPEEAAAYLAGYDAALDGAYPRGADGGALMPFRRLFFVLRRG
jgi:trans-aconitate 2-methyltransferase